MASAARKLSESILAISSRRCELCDFPAVGGGGCPTHLLCENCHRACHATYRRVRERDASAAPMCPCNGTAEQSAPTKCSQELFPDLPADGEFAKLGKLLKATPSESKQVIEFITMSAGSQRFAVEGIYRVANRPLEMMYAQCRERFRKAGDVTERVVFHGTSRQASGSIVKNGFDVSFSGKANGQVHGRGIYVGATASVSLGYTREDSVGARRMFICLAAGGKDHMKNGGNGILVFPREQQVLPCWVIDYK
jgi:hypothetical protein